MTQLFGTKDGGTEGHYYRFAKEGMRGAGKHESMVCDVIDLASATAFVKIDTVDLGTLNWTRESYAGGGCSTSNGIMNKVKAGTSGSISSKLSASKTYVMWGAQGVLDGRNLTVGVYTSKLLYVRNNAYSSYSASEYKAALSGVHLFYELATPITFTSLFLSASSTADELTAMPADAIPLSEIQFADCNWSIEEAIYDAPEADANGVITPTAVTGQMRIQYSLDAAEQIDTLQTEYAALEARVTALENA